MSTDNWRRRTKRLHRAYLRAFLDKDMDRLMAVEAALHRLERQP